MVLPVFRNIDSAWSLGQSGIELNGFRSLPERAKLHPEGAFEFFGDSRLRAAKKPVLTKIPRLQQGRSRERGFLLIAVLVIVVLASMVALSLLFRMRAEEAAFGASSGAEQGWYAALSGIQQAMAIARAAKEPSVWENNPSIFRHQFVVDDAIDKWYFTIYTAGLPEENQPRFGLTDENRKLNLNNATAEMLSKCTVLSGSQIEAIAGTNSTTAVTPSLADPLAPEIFPLEAVRPRFSTLDELLKLPGFAPGVIYGEDANRNFHLDPNEDDGVLLFPPDDSDGQLFLGLQEVATVWSYEANLADDGSPRFQLNSTNRTVPEFIIPEKTATYIQAAWTNKVIFKTPAELLEAKLKVKDDAGKEVEFESGVGPKELPIILDQLTTTFEARSIGLININTASVKVLQAIPGVEGKAEAVVQAREGLGAERKGSAAWLYSEGFLTADEFRRAAPFITARSRQFRFNIIGYALPSGRYRIYEVVIDTANDQPQVSYLRDITKLGLPFALPSGQDLLEVQPKAPTTL
jgi:DNA uptake protein ComE-like DNA-binding protein